MCSCWRERACTYNSRSFGLLPGFQTELFPWNLVNGQNFLCFQGKNYHKMASILPSTSWQMCLVGRSYAQLCRCFSWISEPWERVQLPVGTCSSQLANRGTLGNAFVLSAQLCIPSRCEFQLPFCWPVQVQERIPGTHQGLCSVLCLWAEVFWDYFSIGLWCLLLP